MLGGAGQEVKSNKGSFPKSPNFPSYRSLVLSISGEINKKGDATFLVNPALLLLIKYDVLDFFSFKKFLHNLFTYLF